MAMKQPAIRSVVDVIEGARTTSCGLPDGRWVPARSTGYHSWQNRIRAAFLVFIGKADAVTWPGQ